MLPLRVNYLGQLVSVSQYMGGEYHKNVMVLFGGIAFKFHLNTLGL